MLNDGFVHGSSVNLKDPIVELVIYIDRRHILTTVPRVITLWTQSSRTRISFFGGRQLRIADLDLPTQNSTLSLLVTHSVPVECSAHLTLGGPAKGLALHDSSSHRTTPTQGKTAASQASTPLPTGDLRSFPRYTLETEIRTDSSCSSVRLST